MFFVILYVLLGEGTGPRSFSRRGYNANEDRSVWTDTPADKARKAKEAKVKHIYIYIYIYRERERECVCVCIFIVYITYNVSVQSWQRK